MVLTKETSQGFYHIELGYEQIVEQSVVDKMKEIERMTQIKDYDDTKTGFHIGKTMLNLLFVHSMTHIVYRGIKHVVGNVHQNQDDTPTMSTDATVSQFQKALNHFGYLLKENFDSQEKVYQAVLYFVIHSTFWMMKKKFRKDFCNLNYDLIDGVADHTIRMIDPLNVSKMTKADLQNKESFEIKKELELRRNERKHNFGLLNVTLSFIGFVIDLQHQYINKINNFNEEIEEKQFKLNQPNLEETKKKKYYR